MAMSELRNTVLELSKEPKEQEWFEFKLNNKLDNKTIGEYISALSNSACLQNRDFGYLIWGVNDETHEIEGTTIRLKNKKVGSQELEFWLNLNMQPKIDFSIHEFQYEPNKKICLIKIPAAFNQPTKFRGIDYVRIDSSKTELKNFPDKARRIWNSTVDWSSEIIENATINDLDKEAIHAAKESFRQKNKNKVFYYDIENWDNTTFLEKAKITKSGKITRTAIILLGKSEKSHLIYSDLKIVWIYIDEKGTKRYFEIFDPPFFTVVDKVLSKIHNEQLQILPKNSLITITVDKYNDWIIRELLNNCIAHQDYSKQSRIILTETIDDLTFFNVGKFYQGTIESYILNNFTPQTYRNQHLVTAMVNLGMIETIGSGIKKIFDLQRESYLPLPDYYLTDNVEVTLTGKVINEKYSQQLIENKNLDLGTVSILDKLQKGIPINDTDYYKIIIAHLNKHKKATREDINNLLINILGTQLTETQKNNKIRNILAKMSKESIIENISSSKRNVIWILKQ